LAVLKNLHVIDLDRARNLNDDFVEESSQIALFTGDPTDIDQDAHVPSEFFEFIVIGHLCHLNLTFRRPQSAGEPGDTPHTYRSRVSNSWHFAQPPRYV
jgi:hypothetical protein